MHPEQQQLVREHDAGHHQPIRRDGCPICLELPRAPILPHRDPEPWLEELRRWRRR